MPRLRRPPTATTSPSRSLIPCDAACRSVTGGSCCLRSTLSLSESFWFCVSSSPGVFGAALARVCCDPLAGVRWVVGGSALRYITARSPQILIIRRFMLIPHYAHLWIRQSALTTFHLTDSEGGVALETPPLSSVIRSRLADPFSHYDLVASGLEKQAPKPAPIPPR